MGRRSSNFARHRVQGASQLRKEAKRGRPTGEITMEVKTLEKEAYIATLRALHFQKSSSETMMEKEKLKLQLKKCLRITDELHLECLEEAMKKPRKSEGGKKEKGGAGYGSTDKIATKKRKSTDKSSRKVCLPSTSPAQSTESCSGAPQQSVFPGENLAHAESLALSPAPLLFA